MGTEGKRYTDKQKKAMRKKWYHTMRTKLGVESNHEVDAWMRLQGSKSTHGKGGFHYMAKNDPDRLKKISVEAGRKSHGKD